MEELPAVIVEGDGVRLPRPAPVWLVPTMWTSPSAGEPGGVLLMSMTVPEMIASIESIASLNSTSFWRAFSAIRFILRIGV